MTGKRLEAASPVLLVADQNFLHPATCVDRRTCYLALCGGGRITQADLHHVHFINLSTFCLGAMVMLVPEEAPPRDLKYRFHQIICWGNRQPILTIRRILWIVTAGWALATLYVLACIPMAMSIIFIPFVPNILKIAWFALDPVTKEAVVDKDRFKKPFVIAANVVWLLLFGWTIFIGFLAAALVQVLTIIGIPTALTFWDLGRFALLPFGAVIRTKFLPKTVMEYRAGKSGPGPQTSAGGESPGGYGKAAPLSAKGAPMGENTV